jgi:hypothetical protein
MDTPELEAAGTCLLSTAFFFFIGRFHSLPGYKPALPSHIYGAVGAVVGSELGYKFGAKPWALLFICGLIWIGLWVNYSRFTK